MIQLQAGDKLWVLKELCGAQLAFPLLVSDSHEDTVCAKIAFESLPSGTDTKELSACFPTGSQLSLQVDTRTNRDEGASFQLVGVVERIGVDGETWLFTLSQLRSSPVGLS